MKKIILLLGLFFPSFMQGGACTLTWDNFKDMITGEQSNLTNAEDKLTTLEGQITTATNQYNTAVSNYNTAKSEHDSEKAKLEKLQAQVAADQKSEAAAKAAAEKLEAEQKAQAAESNIWQRGRIGMIINKTKKITYKLQAAAGGVISTISPGSSVAVDLPFANYSQESTGINGALELIPFLANTQVESTSAQADLIGLNYLLSFNMQGMNQPGYMFGAEGQLCISRGYPDGASRAQCIDVESLVTDKDDLWEAEIEIDVFDSNKIYPRIVALKVQKVSASAITQNLSKATINQTTIKITQANMDSKLSYPSMSGSIGSAIWKDVPAK